ncbi:flagellar FliJ protein [Desulfohalotomaculum tongense]|uniref:flagellar export protein FliJ n=1 Tax=Desulforadius tongensis TaxID=1216062 RepID=UPI00195DD4C4|nr:flagellar FliJ family protein [Desulforadius tongensis]MBM7854213.1 flagellar FliJ protein [Desulforadius tongensis]
MKKFSFRLEAVLDQRKKKEQQALVAQSEAEKMYQEQLAALEHTRRLLNESLQAPGCRDLAGELHRVLYREHLKSKIARQSCRVQQAKEKLDEARRAAMLARQERLVIEKLKERQLEEYLQHMRVMEEKLADELATGLYNRKQHSVG